MPSTSSNPATLSMVDETSPLALYSWVTASAAEGSVGDPRHPNRRLNGINVTNQEDFGKLVTRGNRKMNPRVIAKKVISASNIVIKKMPRPSFFISGNTIIPPIAKAMNAIAIFSIMLVEVVMLLGTKGHI